MNLPRSIHLCMIVVISDSRSAVSLLTTVDRIEPAGAQLTPIDDEPDVETPGLGQIIGSPEAGPDPEDAGDRGGWAQLSLAGIMLGAVLFIARRIVRESRSGRMPTRAASGCSVVEHRQGDAGDTAMIENQLESIELFGELTKKERKAVARLMTTITVKAGRDLMVEGTAGREFIIIIEGDATVRRAGRVVARVGAGDFLGELAVIAGVPRTATVTADTEMIVSVLNRREILDIARRTTEAGTKGSCRRCQTPPQPRAFDGEVVQCIRWCTRSLNTMTLRSSNSRTDSFVRLESPCSRLRVRSVRSSFMFRRPKRSASALNLDLPNTTHCSKSLRSRNLTRGPRTSLS